MFKRRLATVVLSAAIGGSALLAIVPTRAASGGIVNGRCSGTSLYSLQVQKEDTGQISVDWGVDMARHTAGVAWHVTVADNGRGFVNATVKTIADGSFSLTGLLPPQATNKITAWASNPLTRETCSASTASVPVAAAVSPPPATAVSPPPATAVSPPPATGHAVPSALATPATTTAPSLTPSQSGTPSHEVRAVATSDRSRALPIAVAIIILVAVVAGASYLAVRHSRRRAA
jgi:hypothetical protein